MSKRIVAVMFVDGEIHRRFEEGEDYSGLYEKIRKEHREAVSRQTEYALSVYKPRYGGWLREKMNVC